MGLREGSSCSWVWEKAPVTGGSERRLQLQVGVGEGSSCSWVWEKAPVTGGSERRLQ